MTRALLLIEGKPARRGFLRNLVAAPAAALATHRLILPAEALVTPADASARMQHHLDGLREAFLQVYPTGELRIRRSARAPVDDGYLARFTKGEADALTIRLIASPQPESPLAAFIRSEVAKKGLLL